MKGKQKVPNIVRGGVAIPLGKNLYYLEGRTHEQGGIDIGSNPKTGIEAERGEVVQMKPDEIRVLSAQPMLGGISPAEAVIRGVNPDKAFNAQEQFKDDNRLNDDGSTYKCGGRKKAENGIVQKVNKSKANFVNRLKTPFRQTIPDWETQYNDGFLKPKSYSTHKLSAWEGDNGIGIIVPNVQEVNGKLIDFTRPPYNDRAAIENAYKTNDVVEVDNFDDALWYTENYKNFYPKFKCGGKNKKSYGGFVTINGNIKNGLLYTSRMACGGRKKAELGTKEKDDETIFDALKRISDRQVALQDSIDSGLLNFDEGLSVSDSNNRIISKDSAESYIGKDNRKYTKQNNPPFSITGIAVPNKDTIPTFIPYDINYDYSGKDNRKYKRQIGMPFSIIDIESTALNKQNIEVDNKNRTKDISKRRTISGYSPFSFVPFPSYTPDYGEYSLIVNDDTSNSFTGGQGGTSPASPVSPASPANTSKTTVGTVNPRKPASTPTPVEDTNNNKTNLYSYSLNPSSITIPSTTPISDLNADLQSYIDRNKVGYNTPATKTSNINLPNVLDYIGLGANIAGNITSGLLTNKALAEVPLVGKTAAPASIPAAKLKTRYNINPQLSQIEDDTRRMFDEISRNTASSNVALARKQASMLAGQRAKNELYGTKENIEAELYNKDALNRQQVAAQNVANYQEYLNNDMRRKMFNAQLEYENKLAKASNVNNMFTGIVSGVQDLINKLEQRRALDKTLTAIKFRNPNAPDVTKKW